MRLETLTSTEHAGFHQSKLTSVIIKFLHKKSMTRHGPKSKSRLMLTRVMGVQWVVPAVVDIPYHY